MTTRPIKPTAPLKGRRLRLVETFARDYGTPIKLALKVYNAHVRAMRRNGHDDDDIEQLCWLGVIRAAQKFDFRPGVKFVTYATWWVGSMLATSITYQGRRNVAMTFVELDKVLHLHDVTRRHAEFAATEFAMDWQKVTARNLTKRQRRALHLRGESLTYREVGQRLSVNPTRAEMICKDAARRIRYEVLA